MQPRRALSLGVAAIAPVLLALAPTAASARPSPLSSQQQPSQSSQPCGDAAARTFPITARLSGGPAGYASGGAARSFALELRNTTASDCHDVHPLVVIVDGKGVLTPRQFTLEYSRPATGRWRSVPFETTDHAENIGLPGGVNGPGIAVPAHAAVTVRLRLRFTGSLAPDRVVASATVMQRRGGDGAWVGESNHYAFEVLPPRTVLAATGALSRRERAEAVLGSVAGALVLGGVALIVLARGRSRG